MNKSPIIGQIPDSLPNYTKPVFTPKDKPEVSPTDAPWVEESQEYYDEPDYDFTREVAQGVQEILEDRPQLTRSEAEEQMHLTELRRLAEGYTENDAIVISEVLAKRYPFTMFTALNNEFCDMKYRLEMITGAVNDNTQQ